MTTAADPVAQDVPAAAEDVEQGVAPAEIRSEAQVESSLRPSLLARLMRCPPRAVGPGSSMRDHVTRAVGSGINISDPVILLSVFRFVSCITLSVTVLWLVNFFLFFWPAAQQRTKVQHANSQCNYNDDQLKQNAFMLLIYLSLFALVRFLTFIPQISNWVARVHEGQRGPCTMYFLHMLLHGPIYVFSIGAVLFWVQILQSPDCEDISPDYYKLLKLDASYSCAESVICLIFVLVHTWVLRASLRDHEQDLRRAPPGTLDKISTCPYDPTKFGDEDGKVYCGECPICLVEWTEEDIIKVPPCGHPFHEECLSRWLRTQRTCAMCRRDLTLPIEAANSAEVTPETLGAASNLV